MKTNQEIESKLKQMKSELNDLFIKRDNSEKQWMFEEYCLQICNHCEKIKLMEWVLNE